MSQRRMVLAIALLEPGYQLSGFAPYTIPCAFQAGHHVRCHRMTLSNPEPVRLAAKGQIPQWWQSFARASVGKPLGWPFSAGFLVSISRASFV
jgi:hypothetical protein